MLPVEYLETIEFHWKFEEGGDGIKIKTLEKHMGEAVEFL